MPAFDWRILLFVLVVTGVTGILFGIAPALRGTRHERQLGAQGNGPQRRRRRAACSASRCWSSRSRSRWCCWSERGCSCARCNNLRHVDVGFNPQNLLLFRVNPRLNRYDEKRMRRALPRHARAARRPSPASAARRMSQPALLSGSVNSTSIFVQGRTYCGQRRDRQQQHPPARRVTQLLRGDGHSAGRPGAGSTPRDDATAPKVVVINEAARGKYFPDEPRSASASARASRRPASSRSSGSSRDAKYDSVRDAAPPTMYVPYPQTRLGSAVFELRTAGDASRRQASVREAVRQIDPNLPLTDVVHADRAGRAALRAGEAVRAGLHAVWRHRAAAGVDRPVRPDVVQRLAAHQRDRHPDGARRAAPGRAPARDAGIDDPGRGRDRPRPGGRQSAPCRFIETSAVSVCRRAT